MICWLYEDYRTNAKKHTTFSTAKKGGVTDIEIMLDIIVFHFE